MTEKLNAAMERIDKNLRKGLEDRMESSNFSAGPSALPDDVLMETCEALVSLDSKPGVGISEISHRDEQFFEITERALTHIRTLYNVPENYTIFFTQGGGWGQFSAVPLNLIASYVTKNKVKYSPENPPSADYIVTGSWSKNAAEEAERIGLNVRRVSHSELASYSITDDKKPAYVYFCDNETVDGCEFNEEDPFPFDKIPSDVPVVADMSSNFVTRPVDVTKYGVIFAGAQKNLGPAGVTVVIARKDLLADVTEASKTYGAPVTPSVFSYKKMQALPFFHTPPTLVIYVCSRVLEKLVLGPPGIGKDSDVPLKPWNRYCNNKSSSLYSLIDESDGFYIAVQPCNRRSRVNVTFKLKNEELTSKLLQEAKAARLYGLAGHRSVGGLRASLYNAVTMEDVCRLRSFLLGFQSRNSSIVPEGFDRKK